MNRHLPHVPGKPGAQLVAQARQTAGLAAGKLRGVAEAAQQGLQRALPGGGLPSQGRSGPDLAKLVRHADGSALAGVPAYRSLREHLMAEHQRDGGESLCRALHEMAHEERRKLEGLLRFGQDLAGCFRDPRRRQRLLNEVLLPGQRGQMSGPESIRRTNAIAGRAALGDGDARTPRWTVGVGIALGAGLGAGGGAVIGLCGARSQQPCIYRALSIGAGATLEADVAFQVQFAPCRPAEFGGLTLEYSAGGGYNATGSVGVAFAPKPFGEGPGVRDRWAFDSVALEIGGGGGIDASMNIEYCRVTALLPA